MPGHRHNRIVFGLSFTVLLVMVSPQAHAQDAARAMKILIWDGGNTAEVAAQQLAKWHRERRALDGVLALASGYPKVVESKDVPGLHPGFHIVVLGFCGAKDAEEPLKVLKAFKSQIYSRAVRVSVDAACPAMVGGTEVLDVVRVRKKPYSLAGIGLGQIHSEKYPPPWFFRFFLRDEAGSLVDTKELLRENVTCLPDMDAKVDFILITLDCEGPGAGPLPVELTEHVRYRIGAGKIEVL